MRLFLLLGLVPAVLISPVMAQRPAPGDGPDRSELAAPGLYSINWGDMGLNVGLSTGPDGVLLIDDQEVAGMARLQTEIAKRAQGPVRIVINSHWHFDHIGGNAIYRKAGATIIAQENTRNRLMAVQVNPVRGNKQDAFAPEFWPNLTFKDSLNLHFNGDDIALMHFPGSHTDGDAIVYFQKANVLFAADLFNNGDYTRVDGRGGSLDGMIAAYDKLLPLLNDSVKVVPGRGRIGTKKDFENYRAVMVALKERIGRLVREGKTLEETVAAKPSRDFDAAWGNGPVRPDQIVEEIYADLKKKS